ncbi:TPA: hypothetical protein O3H02_004307 [Salmonella enterica subsp. enterica serovar Saintpaul str. CFSAN004144]|nr:hypothetical protein [Salmonella enterica subsp. enterica serovar Saintpaul str. CFSAN004144]
MRMKAAVHRFFHRSKTTHSQKMSGNTMKNMNVTNERFSSFNKSPFDTSLDAVKKSLPKIKNIQSNDVPRLIMNGGLRTFTNGLDGLTRFSNDTEIESSARKLLNVEVGELVFSEFGRLCPYTHTDPIKWVKTETGLELFRVARVIDQIAEDAEKLIVRIDAKSVSSPSPSLRHTSDERVPEFGEKRMADGWTDKIK